MSMEMRIEWGIGGEIRERKEKGKGRILGRFWGQTLK